MVTFRVLRVNWDLRASQVPSWAHITSSFPDLFYLKAQSCLRSWPEIVCPCLIKKKTQSEDIQVPTVELCWSHSTPKDCLLNLGTDTNRDLFPLALQSTTGSKLEPSLHISWVKWPSWRYTLRRKERGSLSPPFAQSENTWDLRTATEEEIKDCPSCWEHEIMLCFMSAHQSRKWHWEAQ